MKKSILNLGEALNNVEQKQINGGLKLKPTLCCNPAQQCCTTSYLAQNNQACGGAYISGCQYHPATSCCI